MSFCPSEKQINLANLKEIPHFNPLKIKKMYIRVPHPKLCNPPHPPKKSLDDPAFKLTLELEITSLKNRTAQSKSTSRKTNFKKSEARTRPPTIDIRFFLLLTNV